MVESIVDAFKQIPAGGLVGVVTAAVLLLQLTALVVAYRAPSGRRARVWQIAGVVGVLVATTIDVLAVHAARVVLFSGFAGDDASERASALSAGISGQLNGIALLGSSGVWMGLLGVLGLQRVLEARRPGESPTLYGPLLLIPLGLAAIVVGSMLWATHLIKQFAALAGLSPEMKGASLFGAMETAAPMLARFARVSRSTIVGMTLLAAALIVKRVRSSGPPGQLQLGRPGRTATWLASALALLLAVALWVAVRPLRAENQLPWPAPRFSGQALLVVTPPTPDLAGPDPVVRAPVIQLMADRLALDGRRCSLEELGEMLRTLRTNYQLLHPGERFAGDLIVIADRALTMPRVLSLLRIAHRADYDALMFTFTKEELFARPTMGTLRRVLSSTARASLMDAYDREANRGADPEGDHTVLHAADFSSYEPFARRLVELRRAGRPVVLDLGKDPGVTGEPGQP